MSKALCPRAFDFLLKEIFKSIHISLDEDQTHLNETEGTWVCNCGLVEKTGLPCSHVLKRVICEGENIASYISKFWLEKDEQEVDSKVKVRRVTLRRGRPKKTRRNK